MKRIIIVVCVFLLGLLIGLTCNAHGQTRTPRIYTALISQIDTLAPTQRILYNTFNDTLIWKRVNSGLYKATFLHTKFPPHKLWYYIYSGSYGNSDMFESNIVFVTPTGFSIIVRDGDNFINPDTPLKLELYP